MGEAKPVAFDLEHACLDRDGEAFAVSGGALDKRCLRLR
jgi:hypothetical protein